MLTTVILEGAMGKRFGREWSLDVNSPAEALRMVDANEPGVFAWVRENLPTYEHYRVICEYADGRCDDLDNETFFMERKPVKIRFVPLIAGAGGAVRAVIGVVLIAADQLVFHTQYLTQIGVAMAIGGIVEMLSPVPTTDNTERKDKTSHYFDGPVNTDRQGVPVQLIYGTALCGSHPISASLTIDEIALDAADWSPTDSGPAQDPYTPAINSYGQS